LKPGGAISDADYELLDVTGPVRRWHERRLIVLGTAAVMFIATILAREMLVNDRGVVVGLLFVIPVALVGLELGIGAGVLAAFGTLALVALHPISNNPTLDVVGIITRGTALLAVGILSGRFSDRMRAAQSQQRQLLHSGLELAHLAEPEMLSVMLAEQVKRIADVEYVRVELAGASPVEVGHPADKYLRVPITLRQRRFGALEVGIEADRRFSVEKRLLLAALALQAAVAADNHRLLAVERDRAALQADLRYTQRRLQNQWRSAGRILDVHEQERLEIARQLHEQAAQAMAASLLVVGRLERDIVDDLAQAQLERARHSVRECIAELRQLAGTLRSPVLQEFGLLAALERLCERERSERNREVMLLPEALPEQLPADTETLAYRVTEEMLAALDGPLTLGVGMAADGERLQIKIEGPALSTIDPQPLPMRLATPRARLEMIGGSLEIFSDSGEGVAVGAEVPLATWLDSPVELGQDANDGGLPLGDALRHADPPVGSTGEL
jgi:signal transduction histidine kinase